ncbi:MAG: helix-turn-helix transcriptional regulator [Clostridia bacterium]|nr:helix-turn-helix transcriptional regulator [Clostridia bacterium]
MAEKATSDNLILFFCAAPADVVKCWKQYSRGCHRILFFAKGGAEMTVNGEEFSAGEKTILFVREADNCEFPAEWRENGAKSRHIECYAVFVGERNYASVKRLLNEPDAFGAYESAAEPPAFALDDIQCDKMIRELKDFNQSEDVAAAEQLNSTRLLVARFFYSFIVKGNKPVARFADAPRWFNDYYEMISKPEIFTLPFEQIVALSGKTREHLSRVFKSVTGLNVSDFIVSKRINYACVLLRDGHASIPEIVGKSGFSNVGTFYNNFKKKTGESPERYRKMLLAGEAFTGRKKRIT